MCGVYFGIASPITQHAGAIFLGKETEAMGRRKAARQGRGVARTTRGTMGSPRYEAGAVA
jgi:hypothetical protein